MSAVRVLGGAHAGVDANMSIYAHPDLDAMRQALESIEWEGDL